MFYIYRNAPQYDNISFFYLIFVSQIVLNFLHSDLVVSFYIDVILTFFISNKFLINTAFIKPLSNIFIST